ncbi:hypothetical protein M3201_05450 [Paenibacillus motobuensis]|uniref:hypothetical protein n=1 Tax=Paenibacillus TaxID=44249 RepID=UPI0020421C8F|nr:MULTISPECIES: hypothetical protein [Paenibacillus]MCM3039141.1 hypothetical protein [Paenibacillus lutimineralis]MCM3646245.1 hypothetical protein [Paenibacillus motobuensis]
MRNWPTLFMEPEMLRQRLAAMSILDAILCSEDWLRRYQFNPQWEEGTALASVSNGSGDEMYIVFTPEGVIVKGFDHESDMSPYATDDGEIWPGIYEQTPSSLLSRLNDEALCKEDVTFCLWREPGDQVWRCGDIDFKGLDDGSRFLLGMIYETPQDYVDWAEDYYEIELSIDVVAKIYKGETVGEEMILALNSERDVRIALEEIREIGK